MVCLDQGRRAGDAAALQAQVRRPSASRCQWHASGRRADGSRSSASARTRSIVPDQAAHGADGALPQPKGRTGNESSFDIIHLSRVGTRATRQADGNGAAQKRPFILLQHRSSAVCMVWPLPAGWSRFGRAVTTREAAFLGPSSIIESWFGNRLRVAGRMETAAEAAAVDRMVPVQFVRHVHLRRRGRAAR